MPDKYKKMNLNRENKWTAYLDDEEGVGPHIVESILLLHESWPRSSNYVAKRISCVFTSNSYWFDATALDIDSAERIVLRDGTVMKARLSNQSIMQILIMVSCISEAFGLDIERRE